MRRVLIVLLILSSAFLIAQDANLEKVGESPVSAKFVSGGEIRMEVCPSQVDLTGSEENELRVDYDGGYRDEDVKVRLRITGSHADLKVTGCPSNNFHITVQMPKSSNLYFRMFAGQLNLSGITGDKDVEMHAGQLTLDVGKPEDYFRAEASVLTGDLQASAFNVSKSGLFRSFEQGGPGKYRLHVHVGAGQITLR
jgi:hypothetical protein